MDTFLNKFPVILACDDNYAPQLYVTMLSVLDTSAPTTFVDFFILIPSDFGKNFILDINTLQKKFSNCKITFIDMKDSFSNVKMQIHHITNPTYYRLLAGDLVTKYDKCIYLDTDVIVTKDLSLYFNTNLDDYYVAGVKALSTQIEGSYHQVRLSLPNIDYYINAGVILLNLKKIREKNLKERFLELIDMNFSAQDQDILNVACFGKIKILPLKYNVMTKYHKVWSKYIKNGIISDIEVSEALHDPVIIHYADFIKPWDRKNILFADIWWKYAKMSPYEELFEHMTKQFFSKYTKVKVSILKKRAKRYSLSIIKTIRRVAGFR